MAQILRVLHLEDSDTDAELAAREVRKVSTDAQIQRVQTREEFVAALPSIPDLILSDYALPSFDGLSALALVKEAYPDIPFILVTGTLKAAFAEETAVQILLDGAWDYVLKERIERLSPAIHRVLREGQARRDRRHAEEALRSKVEELAKTNQELERSLLLMTGREERMIDLKRQVNELAKELGRSTPYDLRAFEGGPPVG